MLLGCCRGVSCLLLALPDDDSCMLYLAYVFRGFLSGWSWLYVLSGQKAVRPERHATFHPYRLLRPHGAICASTCHGLALYSISRAACLLTAYLVRVLTWVFLQHSTRRTDEIDDDLPQTDKIDNDLPRTDQIDHDLPRTDQTDHDLDHLDPNLPLSEVVQDMCSTNPTQETCPRCMQVIRLLPGNIEILL